jgi:hypothetical protein
MASGSGSFTDINQTWEPLPTGRPRRRWRLLILLLVTALTAVLIGGWYYDGSARLAAFERAHSAFLRSDCAAVLTAAAEAEAGTVPWGTSVQPVVGGAPEIDQCRELHRLASNWEAGQFATTAIGYRRFVDENDDSPALIALRSLVQKSASSKTLLTAVPGDDACSALATVSTTTFWLEAAISDADDLRGRPKEQNPRAGYDDPAVMVSCAQAFEKSKQTEKASAFYSTALTLKPAKALADTANRGKVRTDIRLAKAAHPGSLPAPVKVSGTGTGPAVVVVHNASRNELDVSMSGPKPVHRTIKACSACEDYYGLAPYSCPQKGAEASFRVPAGSYTVAVRSRPTKNKKTRKVKPFVGSWNLTKGSRYESCFAVLAELKRQS